MTEPLRSRRTWILRLATVVAGTALGLVLAAVLVHRFRHKPSPEEDYGIAALGPCYRIDGDRLVRVVPPHRHGPPASSFPLAKAPGTRRIAVVGESTGEQLERAMADLVAAGGCRDQIQVLECSTFGAPPELAVRRAEEAVRYSPDVLVVAIGHNFRNEVPGNAAKESAMPREGDSRDWSVWGPVPPRARDAYQRIFDVAQPRGVQVIGLELASNLLYRPETDPAYLSSQARAVAWVKWARGDWPAR